MKSILVVRNDRFGEFILNVCVIKSLKKSYPKARITLAVDPYLTDLAECIKEVHQVIAWENKKHLFFDILKFSRVLRQKRFDECIILNPKKDTHLAVFLAGIPKRIGYNRKWPFLLTCKIEDRKDTAKMHEVEYNLEVARLAGAFKIEKNNSLEIDGSLADRFSLSSNLVVVHPFTSDSIKQWPMVKFKELVEIFSKRKGLNVCIVGSAKESFSGKTGFSYPSTNVVNLIGKTSLVELGAVLKRAEFLISCDSGPVHLASAVGTPSIVLFRSGIASKSARRWRPWDENSMVVQKDDLKDVTAEEIVSLSEKYIDKSTSREL